MALLAGGFLLGARAALGTGQAPAGGEAYVVQEGDTLWELARLRVGPEADPRPYVEAIREGNRIGAGHIHPGQLLVLPPV